MDLERGVALSPSGPHERRRLAIFLAGQGDLTRAIAEMRVALAIDPLAAVNWRFLALFQAANDQLPAAIASSGRALEIAPDNDFARAEAAEYAVLGGRPAEALEQARRLPDFSRNVIAALAEHDLGHGAEARRALDALISTLSSSDAETIASVHAWWGDQGAALDWLERAEREGHVLDPKSNPLLRGLRPHPRFKALLARMRLPTD